MKMTVAGGVFATLTLTMEMAAKQRAFHAFIIKSIFSDAKEDPAIYQSILADIKSEADKEMNLIRAALFQFAEIDPTDLLNGTFEI